MATIAIKYSEIEIAENKTNSLEQKPMKGGIPAIDNKQIIKLTVKIGFLSY